jgi:hypothetical protein
VCLQVTCDRYAVTGGLELAADRYAVRVRVWPGGGWASNQPLAIDLVCQLSRQPEIRPACYEDDPMQVAAFP